VGGRDSERVRGGEEKGAGVRKGGGIATLLLGDRRPLSNFFGVLKSPATVNDPNEAD